MTLLQQEQLLSTFRVNNKKGFRISEDFISGLGSFSAVSFGTSSAAGVTSAYTDNGGRPGALVLSLGTTATGQARCGIPVSGSTANILLNKGVWYFATGLQYQTLVSDSVNRFSSLVGFADSGTTTLSVDGVYFRYIDNEFSGNWQAITISNGVQSILNTGILVAANTWYDLEILIETEIPRATFFINKVAFAINSNIPTQAGRQLTFLINFLKLSGTTNRTIFLDYCQLSWDIADER